MKYRMIRFALVGGAGFIVDVMALALFSSIVPFVFARAGSFWIAATSNWWCNRVFTFRDAEKRTPVMQWLKFLLCVCFSFLPNWGCYWMLLEWFEPTMIENITGQNVALFWPYVAMIPGILLGMLTNFILSELWVFRLAEA